MAATPGEQNAVGVSITTTKSAEVAEDVHIAHALGGVSGFETRKRKHQAATHLEVDQVKKPKHHALPGPQLEEHEAPKTTGIDEGSFIRIWTD